jgi:hypothetical protein
MRTAVIGKTDSHSITIRYAKHFYNNNFNYLGDE